MREAGKPPAFLLLESTMAALNTVADYVALARVLLQDKVDSPYRYSDQDLVLSLSLSLQEANKLRPDLFLSTPLQVYAVNDATPVPFSPLYSLSLVMFMVGFAQLRDSEEVTDQRAAAFISIFNSKLLTVT